MAVQPELDAYYSQQPAAPEVIPSDAAPVAPAPNADPVAPDPIAPVVNPWDEIAEEDDLPPSLRGKPRKEVWDALKRERSEAIGRAHQAGQQKNQYEQRLEAAQAIMANMYQQQQAAQQQRPTQQGYERLGLQDPLAAVNDPTAFANSIPQFVQQQQQAMYAHLQENDVAPLRMQLVQLQAENAQRTARSALKIDEAAWSSIAPTLASYMLATNMDGSRPESWIEAVNNMRRSTAALHPQQVGGNGAPAPSTGNARPGTAPNPAAGAKRAATLGSKQADAEARSQLEVWNGVRKKSGQPEMTFDAFVDFAKQDPLFAGLFPRE